MKDFYRILGVSRDASGEVIRTAYLRLSKKFHPDVNPDCKEWAAGMFKEVAEAYEVLGDPVKRRGYDLRQRVTEIPVHQMRHAVNNPVVADAALNILNALVDRMPSRDRSLFHGIAKRAAEILGKPKKGAKRAS